MTVRLRNTTGKVRRLYPIISIILAGGKGTRMHSADRHKVCFDINGRPAIVRAIDTYTSCGIDQHVLVVGALAGQVVETVGKHHPGAIYVYQAEQLGTGHATKQGAAVLAALRYEGAVLVVAGDRLLDTQVVEQLIAEYRSTAADMAFLVSAACEKGAVQWIEVQSAAGAPLRLISPWPVTRCRRGDGMERVLREALIEMTTSPGETLRFVAV